MAHKFEKELLNDKVKNASIRMYCGPKELDADIYVEDKEKIKMDDFTMTFIHTPGHTKGGMCIRIGENLFTGDTLFAGSIGRTDLYSANHSEMIKSLKKLSKYEDNLVVYPGHGPKSNLKREKINNMYMRNL